MTLTAEESWLEPGRRFQPAFLGSQRHERSDHEPHECRRRHHGRQHRYRDLESVEVQHSATDWYCGITASQFVAAERFEVAPIIRAGVVELRFHHLAFYRKWAK